MLDANPRLLPLGAERLIAVDRFLLGPNEAWPVTPPGHFSYLVARAEQPLTEPPARVSPELLLVAARSLSALLEAARREGILLNLAPEEMSLSGEGRIHLRHPGLNPQDGPSMDEAAMAFLQSLPLEAEARASISGATSVEDVIARFSPPSAPPEDATVLVDRSRLQQESETVLRRPDEAFATQVLRPAAAQATPPRAEPERATIGAELRSVKAGTRFGPASFELLLRNNADEDQRVRLRPHGDDANVSILDSVDLSPGQSWTVPFTVRPRKARLFGGPIDRSFDVAVSGDLGGPVETCRGTFRDESRPWLPLGAGTAVAVIAAVLLLMLGGGGGSSSSNVGTPATSARNHLTSYEFKAALADFDKAISRDANDATLYSGRARAQLNLAAFTPALADANKAIQINPANAEAYYVQSQVYNELWQYEQAVTAASKAIELEPNNALYYASRSQIYGEREATKQSQDASRAMQLDPNNAEVHASWGSSYNTQKKYADADAEYTKAIALQPKDGLLYVSRAMVQYRAEDYEQALKRLTEDEKVIASYPLAGAEGEMARGSNNHGAGRYPQAIGNFNKANEIIEEWPAYYYWHGYTYYSQKDYATALRDFGKAIELSPTEPATYIARGLVNRDQGKLDAAFADMSRAVTLNPASADNYSERGYVLLLLDNYEAALADCAKAIELDASLYYPHYVRSLVRIEQKRYGDALADVNRAIQLRPNDAELLANRGFINYELDNYPAALTDLTASLTIRPDSAYTYNRRGNVHYIMRNYQPAVDDYTKAIQYNANDAQFYLNRGSAFENLRRVNEARADYEKARSIAPTPQLRQDAQNALNALR